jgi:hypothetical protein
MLISARASAFPKPLNSWAETRAAALGSAIPRMQAGRLTEVTIEVWHDGADSDGHKMNAS